MSLLKTCIREPVIAIVLSLVLLVLGAASYMRLNMSYLPQVKIPVVSINTSYTGAPASLMEAKVTNILENNLGSIDGIESMSSSSGNAYSRITIDFKLGGDFDRQINDVRDKVNAATADENWPSSANRPTITVGMSGQEMMGVGFASSAMSSDDIRDYLINVVSKQIMQVPGVASASVKGGSSYAMRVALDPDKMAALGITVSDIEAKLKAENVDIAGGSIQAPTRTYSIVSHTRFSSPQDFGQLVLKQDAQSAVYLKDVAKIEFASDSVNVRPMRINGKPAHFILITPKQGINPLRLDGVLKNKLQAIQSGLPSGMTMRTVFDNTHFLRTSILDTFKTIFEAILLVIVVVILFLGSLRAALVPIITIPVSLIAVFSVIYVLGFSINVMSLLALVLAIGLVVDDAIVMLENIHRHIERGMAPLQAAIKGCQEMVGAVVAMSLTLVAVYAPIGMVTGVTAILFKQFAFTLAATVLISGFIALTLSPMMCSRLLREPGREAKFSLLLERIFTRLAGAYRALLAVVLQARTVVVCVVLVVAVSGVMLLRGLPSQLLPQEDQGKFMVMMRAPAGSRLTYTDPYVQQVESILLKQPDIADVVTLGDAINPAMRVFLKPWDRRQHSVSQLISILAPQLKKVTGITAAAMVPQLFPTSVQQDDIDYNITTNATYQQLMGVVNQVLAQLRRYPGLTNLSTNLKFDAQQYSVQVNRDLAAKLGVSLQDISYSIGAMVGSKHVADVSSGQKSYRVTIQMQREDLARFDLLNKLYVHSSGGANPGNLVPLSSLVTLKPTIGQSSLAHFNRMRSATITASLSPGYVVGQAVREIQTQARRLLPSGFEGEFSGQAAQFLDSGGTMLGVIGLAFIFIYLVLAAQFRSFIDPFIVLLAVPLSAVGAAIMLHWVGGTLNLYSEIGMVTLIGLISKHGILITQFINTLRREGMPLQEAILNGAAIRLRPILMTTAAMVFGTLPLALASGPGSVGREQIGAVIVGGLLVGTIFSLLVVPVAYLLFSGFKPAPRPITEGDQITDNSA